VLCLSLRTPYALLSYHNLTRVTGYDAVMTVRVSNGLKVSEYFGHAQRRFPSELELPMIDADKTFAIRITHENALPKDTQEVCIQVREV
jgi:protein transport protein SEC24